MLFCTSSELFDKPAKILKIIFFSKHFLSLKDFATSDTIGLVDFSEIYMKYGMVVQSIPSGGVSEKGFNVFHCWKWLL